MPRKAAWATMTVSAMLIALYAVATTLVPGLRGPFVAELVSRAGFRAFGHMGAGGVALAVGALQFSTGIRLRRPRTHRRLGLTYVVAVWTSGVAAVLLAPVSSGGLPAHYGFGLLGVLWLGTSGVAYLRARAHDYEAHREWMIRSYALCLAAVTLRIYLPVSAIAAHSVRGGVSGHRLDVLGAQPRRRGVVLRSQPLRTARGGGLAGQARLQGQHGQ